MKKARRTVHSQRVCKISIRSVSNMITRKAEYMECHEKMEKYVWMQVVLYHYALCAMSLTDMMNRD